MGKGKRAREERATFTKEPVKKSGFGDKLSAFFGKKAVKIIATVLVVAILVGGFGYLGIREIDKATGISLRNTVSITTENFEMNNAMVAYLFGTSYLEFYNQYYYYMSYLGLDPSVSLKKQNYGERTWFDYFMDMAVNSAKQILILAEGALADGEEFTEEDQKKMDETIDELKATAKANGMSLNSYLGQLYGNGIKEKDVRAVMEIQALASKKYESLTESYEFDAEDYEKYCEENKDKFYTMEYVYYKFDDAEKAAEVVETAKTYEEFVEYVKNYAVEKAEADKKEGTTVDADKVKEDAEADLEENTTTYAYAQSTELDKWLFDAERKVGDMYAADTAAYWVLETQSRNEDLTRNVRHILLDTEEKANELLAEWKKDPSVEKFTQLVKDNTLDPGSIDNGGLYENVAQGDMVTEFDEWLFNEERKLDDSAVVHAESTGYHVMWYVGDSALKTWEAKADSYLKSDAYEADYDLLEEAHTVNVDYKLLSKIPG